MNKFITLSILGVLSLGALNVLAAERDAAPKVPSVMSDAQMKEVVGAGSPGFGLCTATAFANGNAGAPGAIANWTAFPILNGPGNGNGNGNGNGSANAPGFGNYTAKNAPIDCGLL